MYGSDGFLLQFLESSPGRRKQYLPSTLRERMHVHDLLVGLHRTDHLSWLECQVVHGIADQACKAFFASEIQEKADSHELRFTNNRKKNPAERHRAVAMAWARASKKEKKSQKMSSKARAAVKAAAARAKTWLSSRDKRSERGAYFVAALQSLLWLQTSLRVSGCESRRRPEAEPFRHAGFRVRRGVLGPASGSVGCGGFGLLLS